MRYAVSALALTMFLSIITVACTGTPPPDPTATEAITQPPTATQPSQPTQTLSPTRRAPVQTLNPRQIQATQRAQLATIKVEVPKVETPFPTPQVIYPTAPRPFPTLEPTPIPWPTLAPPLPTLEPPPILGPLPTLALPTLEPFPTLSPLPTLKPPSTLSPLPTFEPLPTVEPLPTFPPITLPRLTPTPAPPLVAVAAGVADFALACADITNRDESAPDWTFEGWVTDAQTVKAPSTLADWWSAYVDQFALQVVHDGPSEYSQDAADMYMTELAYMDFEIREYLMDTGCVTGTDVWLADATLAAWDRLQSGYGQGEDVSVDEFARACNDIKLIAPTMDKLSALPLHMAYWWAELTPPPEIADYYAAVAAFYEEWIKSGEDDPVSAVSLETQMAATNAALALDGDVLDILLARQCAS